MQGRDARDERVHARQLRRLRTGCTHTLPHEGMVYAVAMGEGYVLGGTVERVVVWQSELRKEK